MLGSRAQWGKSSPWEESIRIPFIIGKVGGPDNMSVGGADAVINHVDIAPTTLGLCGIPGPAEMVGHDYSAHCIRSDAPEYKGPPESEKEPDSAFLQQIPRKMHLHTVNKAWRGVVMCDGWKYICTPGNDWPLFTAGFIMIESAECTVFLKQVSLGPTYASLCSARRDPGGLVNRSLRWDQKVDEQGKFRTHNRVCVGQQGISLFLRPPRIVASWMLGILRR